MSSSQVGSCVPDSTCLDLIETICGHDTRVSMCGEGCRGVWHERSVHGSSSPARPRLRPRRQCPPAPQGPCQWTQPTA